MKRKILFYITFLFLVVFSACATDKNEDVEISIDIDKEVISFDAKKSLQSVIVTSNSDEWTISKDIDASWLTIKKTSNGVDISVAENKSSARSAKVAIKGGLIVKYITVSQAAGRPDVGGFSKDILIKVASAKASENQPGGGIELSIDGDYNTNYHSRWGNGTVLPVTLEYFFDETVDIVDYLTVFGRATGVNGAFQEFDVYVKSKNGVEQKNGTYNFQGDPLAKNITLNLTNPEYVKFVVKSGVGGFVSCAEMEFYKNAEIPSLDAIFTDKSYSKLQNNITLADINKLDNELLKYIAIELYNGTYESKYRVQHYKPILSPNILGSNLKIGNGFSRYEGITGIYLKEGESVVFVGNTGGKTISLLLPNWMRQPTPGYAADKDPQGWGLKVQSISLKEGINVIDVKYSTNAYINYYVEDVANSQEVTIHFPLGEVNGYFDASVNSNDDWNMLLSNAVSPIMDAKGKYVQVAYPVEYFKQFAMGKGVELLNNYDKMLLNHYTFMGLKKYNRMPDNRILARVNYNYYMFRDQDGVAYLGDQSTMRMVTDPSEVVKGDACWGFSHEVGHVLQMSPQLTWGGLTEVSNNLYSLYTTIALGNQSRLMEQGQYAKARADIIETGISYLQAEDVFSRLVPFWQLHLYFSRNGKPEFYADVMEELRNRNHVGLGNDSYKNMFEYIKICCDVGKLDLTEFFDKWGFFYVGNISLTDYESYNYNISQQEVDATKSYIASKNYPKPSIDITMLQD